MEPGGGASRKRFLELGAVFRRACVYNSRELIYTRDIRGSGYGDIVVFEFDGREVSYSAIVDAAARSTELQKAVPAAAGILAAIIPSHYKLAGRAGIVIEDNGNRFVLVNTFRKGDWDIREGAVREHYHQAAAEYDFGSLDTSAEYFILLRADMVYRRAEAISSPPVFSVSVPLLIAIYICVIIVLCTIFIAALVLFSI